MLKNCKNCSVHFEVTQLDEAFYQKMGVSDPWFCPPCRSQRRLSYRNDRSLYHAKSALTGKDIISMYNPDNGYIVYDHSEWNSEAWNPLDYGVDFDFDQPFFEQFYPLQKRVPRFNVFNVDCENCEFVNYAPHNKNCYLIFGGWFNEGCLYGQTLNECKNSVDVLFLDRSELCYECTDCNSNYNCAYCQNTNNTRDSMLCFDCQNIDNCIACWNLRGKRYHIFNKPVTKEVFDEERRKFSSYSYTQKILRRFHEFVQNEAIHRDMIGNNNQHVSGNLIFNSKNVTFGFFVHESEDVAYCGRVWGQKNSYDFDGGGKGELAYESMSNDFAYNSICSMTCEHLTDAHYCDLCFSCTHCFGCVALRQKKWCIFNKQYSEEAYKNLSAQIMEHMKKTGEWGEFFPIKYSPFAYNETLAQEYFPLTEDDARSMGYKWLCTELSPRPEKAALIPDSICDIDDSILSDTLVCETCAKNYRIIRQELSYYTVQNIPIPHDCPNCRHAKRMSLRTPRILWKRKCHKCQADIETSYSPDRSEKVYCEKCYLQSIY